MVLGLVQAHELRVDERVGLVELIERAKSRLDAAQVRAVEAVAATYETLGMTASEARHEVGAALRLSPATAADRVQVAVDLVRRFPAPWRQGWRVVPAMASRRRQQLHTCTRSSSGRSRGWNDM